MHLKRDKLRIIKRLSVIKATDQQIELNQLRLKQSQLRQVLAQRKAVHVCSTNAITSNHQFFQLLGGYELTLNRLNREMLEIQELQLELQRVDDECERLTQDLVVKLRYQGELEKKIFCLDQHITAIMEKKILLSCMRDAKLETEW